MHYNNQADRSPGLIAEQCNSAAEKCLQRAIELSTTAMERSLAESELARTMWHQKRLAEAWELISKAKEVFRKPPTVWDQYYMKLLDRMAGISFDLHSDEQALALYRKTLDYRREFEPEIDSKAEAIDNFRVGLLLHRNGKSAESIKYLERAQKLYGSTALDGTQRNNVRAMTELTLAAARSAVNGK